MALAWSTRRQALYYGVAAVVGAVLLFGTWETFFVHTPTCSDGLQNGTEIGVDCGGSCALLCKNQARSPVVRWARSFRVDDTHYSAAAYIDNPNQGAGSRGVQYSFRLYDAQNALVKQVDGVTDLPPMSRIPIIEANINTGSRTVARTLFTFSAEPAWSRVVSSEPKLQIAQQGSGFDGTRLSALLTNDSVTNAGKVVVHAILFDVNGIALGASKTTISKVARKSSVPVVFTWPTSVANVATIELTVVPTF